MNLNGLPWALLIALRVWLYEHLTALHTLTVADAKLTEMGHKNFMLYTVWSRI